MAARTQHEGKTERAKESHDRCSQPPGMRMPKTADLGTQALLVVNSFKLHLNALSDNYMENIIKCSHPKMTGQNDRQDESLTRQVHDQAGHCLLTGCYFEPCNINCCIGNLLALIGVVLLKTELSSHSSISN